MHLTWAWGAAGRSNLIAETKVVERDARSRSKRLAADSNVRVMAAV